MGQIAENGLIIALSGNLGAGKTTFTQGLAHGMGICDRVTSPTFTLVNEYTGRDDLRLIHIDTYRLGAQDGDAGQESTTFGLEEILLSAEGNDDEAGAVMVIEWAERIQTLLPPDHLHIWFTATDSPEQRHIDMKAFGPRSERVLSHL